MHLVPVLTEPPRERLAGPELLPTEGCSRGSPKMSAADRTSALPGSPANMAALLEKSSLTRKTIHFPLARPGGLFQKQESMTM